MYSVSTTGNDNVNKYFINIDFGVVPVGSVRKRSIDVTNDLKASSYFFANYMH